MKHLTIVLLAAIFSLQTWAQEPFLWPVEGKKTGENILYQPQSYIGQELNSSNLIIAAPLNTNILAPVDGIITTFNYNKKSTMDYGIMYRETPTDFQQDSLYFAEQGETDVKYIHLCVGIKTGDGRTVYLSGLRPSRLWKTGQKVRRGEVIGTTGFYYKKISEPCICIQISRKGIAADPMSPFGLKTTFQEPDLKQKSVFTKEEASEDYNIFVDALKEGFPGLYDYVSEAEFEQFTSAKRNSFGETASFYELEDAIQSTLSIIRDSHSALMNPKPSYETPHYSSIDFGIQGDSMVVTRALLPYSKYIGKKILTVDGIPCDSMKALIRNYHTHSDGFVESRPEWLDLCQADLAYCRFFQTETNRYDLFIEFADGERKLFKGEQYSPKKRCVRRTPSWKNWYFLNLSNSITFRQISDSTSYLGLGNFDLNEVELEQIKSHFAQMVADSTSNLILDLRNNSGGSQEVMKTFYSYLAQEPFRQDLFQKVNKRGDFGFFRYSTNHGTKYCQKCAIDRHGEGEILFPEYLPSADGDGFVLDLSDQWCQPDSVVNYKGKVYLLVNERSQSASAVFAGWVKKQWRGAIVGRETGSAYHQMKAVKFENLMLPHSKYIVCFPLVKTVMDTVVNKRFPFGRGVLPDYPVQLTLKELSSLNDSILEYTLHLIENGDYLTYVPEEEEATVQETDGAEEKKSSRWIWVLAGLGILGIAALMIRKSKK